MRNISIARPQSVAFALPIFMAIKKLLFVDTNIWLDFYRARTEAGLALLKHLNGVTEIVIANYQLESEFKKNRHAAILEGLQELKPPQALMRPGFLSDAKSTGVLRKSLKEAEARVKKLKQQAGRIFADPGRYDPVYKTCQRIFHRDSSLVLKRENTLRREIRRKAFRRFLHGCPPRKRTDTSIGDAFNWEWMIHCANENSAELVIVSRDSDYGVTYEDTTYINDHLRQEFAERVSKKRKILLYAKLSDALKHFEVKVTEEEEKEEAILLEAAPTPPNVNLDRVNRLLEYIEKIQAEARAKRELKPPAGEG